MLFSWVASSLVLQREGWGTRVQDHTAVCSPWVSAALQWQHPSRVRNAGLLCSTSTFLPFSLFALRSLRSPCPDVSWDLPVSVWFIRRAEAIADTEMTSWEIQPGLCSTVSLTEIKQCSPRYLFSNLLFQRKRENYRPLITQGEERKTSIFVISSTTIRHFRKRAWKPEIVSQGSFHSVPPLITHQRNKNEDSSSLLRSISKSICPRYRDWKLRLLGTEILSFRKVPLLFPGWLYSGHFLRLDCLVTFL